MKAASASPGVRQSSSLCDFPIYWHFMELLVPGAEDLAKNLHRPYKQGGGSYAFDLLKQRFQGEMLYLTPA